MHAARQSEKASVTLTALCFTIVLAISLSSYLALSFRSYHLSTRQMHEDRARQLAQAGLEEALWALNQNNWTSAGPASSGAWTTSGANRTITASYGSLGQGETGQLSLTVGQFASVGPVNWPFIISTATLTLDDGQIVTKTLQASTRAAALFGNAAAAANGSVTFTSGGALDSYDSSKGTYNQTSFPFSVASPNVGSVAVVAGADVTITNAIVNGYAATYFNPIAYSGSGKVKKLSGGVMDFTRIGKSAYIPVATVNEPNEAVNFTGRLTGGTQTIGTPFGPTEYWYTDPTVNSGRLDLGSGDTLTINGSVKIRIYNDLLISGTGTIKVIASLPGSKSRAEIFVGDDILISGSGGIQNNTTGKLPKNVVLYSTTSYNGSRVFDFSSTADFNGVILSEANQVLTVSSDATFFGAILATNGNLAFSGSDPILHYDLALRNLPANWFSGVAIPFVIDQLTEP